MAGGWTTPYPEGLYPEQLPSWLGFATTWAGRSSPDTTRPFRYLDLGCGVGHTACWVKRCYPHADVTGVDLDPGHIEASRALASRLGVDVRFVQGPFEAVDAPADIVVAHGVWSWIDDATRADLAVRLSSLVAEGGLLYVDYNALPGRSDWVALAGLLRTLAPQLGRDAEGLDRALEALEPLDGTGFFARRPGLTDGLRDALRRQPGYLVHEFLSQGWRAFLLSDVARQLAPLTYVGTTHLWEAVEGFRTTEVERSRLSPWSDPVVRDTLRDALRDTVFRHDVFQQGGRVLSADERQASLLARHYALGRPPGACRLASIPGHPQAHPLPPGCLDVVRGLDGPPRTGQALLAALEWAPDRLVDRLGLLCAAGYVYPADRELFPPDVDDLLAQDVDLLPLVAPSGIEVSFTRIDRAIWRSLDTNDVVGRALELLGAEGHRLPARVDGVAAQRRAMEAALATFRAAIPDLVRAGWSFAPASPTEARSPSTAR